MTRLRFVTRHTSLPRYRPHYPLLHILTNFSPKLLNFIIANKHAPQVKDSIVRRTFISVRYVCMFCRTRVEWVTVRLQRSISIYGAEPSSGYRERYVSDCTNTNLLPFLCFKKSYCIIDVDVWRRSCCGILGVSDPYLLLLKLQHFNGMF